MAYRRSLMTTSASLLTPHRFSHPAAFSYTHDHEEDDLKNEKLVKMSFLQSRSFGNNTNTWLGFSGGRGMSSFRDPKRSQVTSGLMLFARNMSTTSGGGNGDDGEEKIGLFADLADKIIEVVSSHYEAAAVRHVSHEVVVAAADSCLPVAALQHAIDGIHTYTGLNWWASIAITTLLIRTLSVPLMVRASVLVEEIKQAMDDKGFEGRFQMKRLYKQHGVCQFIISPLKVVFIHGGVFVTFCLAIQNMVEKVPSFQTGGIYWFIDLTTADSLCILPYLAAFSFWIHMQDFSKGDPDAIKRKYAAFTSLSALTVPLAATFPNALLCYWITSNLFSYVYRLIIKALLPLWRL